MSAAPMLQSLRDGHSPLLQDHSNLSLSASELRIDEEKWPVSQRQPMIVVTRTYQEEKARERRRRIFAAICLLVLISWLVWAFVVTI